ADAESVFRLAREDIDLKIDKSTIRAHRVDRRINRGRQIIGKSNNGQRSRKLAEDMRIHEGHAGKVGDVYRELDETANRGRGGGGNHLEAEGVLRKCFPEQ